MKIRHLLVPLLLITLFGGCTREKEEIVSTFPSGAKKETGIYQGKKPNRSRLKSFEYYETGERKKEFSLRDNHFFGPWSHWYKNGKKLAEGSVAIKTMDHQKAVGTGTFYWPGGARMITLGANADKTATEVTGIYDEAGKFYTVKDCPPELSAKIKGILDKWEKGEL